jgi:hypothetical protein
MFGSDNFPLGPAGGFPRVRRSTYGAYLIPGVSAQDTYLSGGSSVSKLPNLERDFDSSNKKVKGRLTRNAKVMRGTNKGPNRFRPRFAPFFGQDSITSYFGRDGRLIKGIRSEVTRLAGISGEDFEDIMDTDPVYDGGGSLTDEGETDDSVGSVGYYRGRDFRGRMSPFAGLLKRGVSNAFGRRRR